VQCRQQQLFQQGSLLLLAIKRTVPAQQQVQ
jgi:hypothetical protein